jgi:hypothetical protein
MTQKQRIERLEMAMELVCFKLLGKRLEGMEGPEQGLVGESRSDGQQGAAEEVKPGELDVEKIVGAVELRLIIECEVLEARREIRRHDEEISENSEDYYRGKEAAMVKLLEWVCITSDQRSDLFNAGSDAPGANEKP